MSKKMEKTIRILGIIGLVSVISPEFINFGAIANIVLGVVGTVVGCYLFYLLGKAHGDMVLFKTNLVQTLVLSPVVLLLSLVAASKNSLTNNFVLYSVLGATIILLLFLAFTNYKLAKHLGVLSKKVDSLYFKYSSILLFVSAYTMPVLIGFLFFAIAFVLFLLGCIMYKSPAPSELSRV